MLDLESKTVIVSCADEMICKKWAVSLIVSALRHVFVW